MTKTCDQCGKTMIAQDDIHAEPCSTRAWCSEACGDEATKDEPGWEAVSDLSSLDRAELVAILGLSEAEG